MQDDSNSFATSAQRRSLISCGVVLCNILQAKFSDVIQQDVINAGCKQWHSQGIEIRGIMASAARKSIRGSAGRNPSDGQRQSLWSEGEAP